MKKVILSIFMLLLFSAPAFCIGNSLEDTIYLLKESFIEKNVPILLKHIDLDGIIRNKIRKYSRSAKNNKSLFLRTAGRVAGASEGMLVSTTATLAVSEFNKAPEEKIREYIDTVKFDKIGENNSSGYAIGSFWGKPFLIAAIKNSGDWKIIAVESTLIDAEIENALKRIR